ncbi:Uncharacterised protein [Yersinia pekkanenii]|uniref:Uncharacterized protein n=1 Tax=Yersinia pekkanenii TaxID=1288385 RepID=A0A0T9PTB3_9GAMM|nr:Uncharacterised protein [Yersinia pekkanenii]
MRLIRIKQWWLETTQAIDLSGEPIAFRFNWLIFVHIDNIEEVHARSQMLEEVRRC